MSAITHQKAFGDPIAVSSQIDWSGALEVTFEVHGAQDYAWPLTKTFGTRTLRRVSVTENTDYHNQAHVISQASYRGKGFTRDAVSIEAAVTSEPITANAHFAAIAGTPEDPITTHAIWEEKNGVNKFVQWRDDSPHAGIEHYLAPEWTATVEWLNDSIVGAYSPGVIYTLPTTEGFGDSSSFSWLCSSISQQPHGSAYRISAQLIGAPNWPSLIYPTT